MKRIGWIFASVMTLVLAGTATAQQPKPHDGHKPCCTPGAKGACCVEGAKAGECCKGKDCCKGQDCCDHAADHVAKSCCTPGTPGACCPAGGRTEDCCKGKDCCKGQGEHCCHAAAELKDKAPRVPAKP